MAQHDDGLEVVELPAAAAVLTPPMAANEASDGAPAAAGSLPATTAVPAGNVVPPLPAGAPTSAGDDAIGLAGGDDEAPPPVVPPLRDMRSRSSSASDAHGPDVHVDPYAPYYYAMGGFPCCRGRKQYVSRWVYAVAVLFTAIACCGAFWGWFSLVGVLAREGFFSTGCAPGGGACKEQALALNGIYSAAAICSFVSPMGLGVILDRYGPRVAMRLVSAVFALGPTFLIIATATRIEGLLYPGFICMAIGSTSLVLPLYNYANMFPRHEGFALALLNGCFDAAALVFLIMRTFYEAGASLQTVFIAYLGGPVAVLLFNAAFLWRPMPFLPLKLTHSASHDSASGDGPEPRITAAPEVGAAGAAEPAAIPAAPPVVPQLLPALSADAGAPADGSPRDTDISRRTSRVGMSPRTSRAGSTAGGASPRASIATATATAVARRLSTVPLAGLKPLGGDGLTARRRSHVATQVSSGETGRRNSRAGSEAGGSGETARRTSRAGSDADGGRRTSRTESGADAGMGMGMVGMETGRMGGAEATAAIGAAPLSPSSVATGDGDAVVRVLSEESATVLAATSAAPADSATAPVPALLAWSPEARRASNASAAVGLGSSDSDDETGAGGVVDRVFAVGQAESGGKADDAREAIAAGTAAATGGAAVAVSHVAEDLTTLRAWQQLQRPEFYLYAVFFAACMLRYNMYIGTIDTQLTALGQSDDGNYSRIFGIIAPLGFFVQFIVGPVLDRFGILFSLYTQWVIVVGLSIVNLIPSLQIQPLAFVLFVAFRAFHFSNMTTYLARSFGYLTLGLTIGLTVLAGGLVALLQTALLQWAFVAPGATATRGNFTYPNALLLAVTVAVGFFPIWLHWRHATGRTRV